MMKEKAADYLPLAEGFDDKAKDKAIQHFAEEKFARAFLNSLKSCNVCLMSFRPIRSCGLGLKTLKNWPLYSLIRNAYDHRLTLIKS